jgi:Cu/Zn superoxide dismutase
MKKVFLIVMSLLLVLTAVTKSSAQWKDMKSEFNLNSDTVTNAGVSYLQIHNPGQQGTTAFWVTVTEISGTTAGSIAIHASPDGTNWKAMSQEGTQTAVVAASPTDVASNTYNFWFENNPFNYYRVVYTGAGTMSARFSAKMLSR